mmetsp:Transcript_63582/g.113144  ORF Transcript_63582/g.113144 Transcript_63582/m.113144 type:complete len:244 (-) Transcript_63582:125-856(-)|eukprot:CAMPEP_0197623388 /NCGR_PEP_ID=MMETSP1338-20131121/3416_1 /TAXON_ID=43686 ORGANISM="Pelagodinium beii, Strain RCC1491" /NCGR_SAMPLE_ID=MMETSP1338 /ASSEMBLY_ACC=CAM_ASM_000754 /LENGTH=243 /DNA_ID=CAMNT_0043193349 /DNA_START=38 /DNA_END=769 /DNA_ORIENTATION=+
MEPAGTAEEDPFSEFLSQEQGVTAAYAPAAEPEGQGGAEAALQLMAASAQRQEQLLGKVCSLLMAMDEKMGRMETRQERLESTLQRLVESGAAGALSGSGMGSAAQPPRSMAPPAQRGNLVAPPGKTGYAPSASAGAGPSPEEQRLQAERLAADRMRMEEENRRRAEEMERRRQEDERRKREEEERRRLEEERRKEEERLRKEALEKKTMGLMSNLISTNSSAGGLFGDEEPPRKSKGGLFDD